MRCPYCSGPDSKVIDSRAGEENKVIRRRRECFVCRKRFSTYERLEPLPLMVIKSNGTREPFDTTKLREGLIKACEKRPISIDTIEKIVAEVEYAISNYVMEVPSKIIGEMVLEKLEKLDPVSYLRFASVHKGFKSVDDFIELATLLRSRSDGRPSDAEKKAHPERSPSRRGRQAVPDHAAGESALEEANGAQGQVPEAPAPAPATGAGAAGENIQAETGGGDANRVERGKRRGEREE